MPRSPLNLFCAYNQADVELQQELLTHLALWKRKNIINIWSHDQIQAGREADNEMIVHLEQADLVLLLLSANFLASDEYDLVVERALKLQMVGKTRVIPILLRPVDLTDTPLALLKLLPTNGQAVTNWPRRDNAFWDIQRGIQRVLAELNEPSTEKRNLPAFDRRVLTMTKETVEGKRESASPIDTQRRNLNIIDLSIAAAQEIGADQHSVTLPDLHAAYLRANPGIGKGKTLVHSGRNPSTIRQAPCRSI